MLFVDYYNNIKSFSLLFQEQQNNRTNNKSKKR